MNAGIVWLKPTKGEIAGTVEYAGRTFRARVDERADGRVEARLWPDGRVGVSGFYTLRSGDDALRALADRVFSTLETPPLDQLCHAVIAGLGNSMTVEIDGVTIISGEMGHTPGDWYKNFLRRSRIEAKDGSFAAAVTTLVPIRPADGVPERIHTVEFTGDEAAFRAWVKRASALPHERDPDMTALFWLDFHLAAGCDATHAWTRI